VEARKCRTASAPPHPSPSLAARRPALPAAVERSMLDSTRPRQRTTSAAASVSRKPPKIIRRPTVDCRGAILRRPEHTTRTQRLSAPELSARGSGNCPKHQFAHAPQQLSSSTARAVSCVSRAPPRASLNHQQPTEARQIANTLSS
jgi:hypothetical protein